MSESIGLELCESLHKYCVDRNISTFKLVTRFSVGGTLRQRRWDADFIRAQLSSIEPGELKKVWVCGPPAMNETFDRCLDRIGQQYGLNRNQWEIL